MATRWAVLLLVLGALLAQPRAAVCEVDQHTASEHPEVPFGEDTANTGVPIADRRHYWCAASQAPSSCCNCPRAHECSEFADS